MRAMNKNGIIVLDCLSNTRDVGRAAAIAAETHFAAKLVPMNSAGGGFFELELHDRVSDQFAREYILRLMLLEAVSRGTSLKDVTVSILREAERSNLDVNAKYDPLSDEFDVDPTKAG